MQISNDTRAPASARNIATRILCLTSLVSGCAEAQPISPNRPALAPAATDALAEAPRAQTSPKRRDSAAPQQPTEPPKIAVELTPATFSDVEQWLATQRGNVVVLDLWSTSCDPCLREFPHLVELSKSGRKQLVCSSFACDYVGIASRPPTFYAARVTEFLRKQDAALTNFLSQTPADELFSRLTLDSIPAVFVYAPDGSLARRFDNRYRRPASERQPETSTDSTKTPLREPADDDSPFSYAEDIIPFVEHLLNAVAQ